MGFLPVHGILLLVLVSSSLPPSSVSDSRLLPGKPLTVGSTLVSDDGTFALGFFSLSNSTKNHYYVGIWYNNIPKDNVVWIANRATPITDPSSAALAITKGSNLVVSDTKNGQLLWVANISAARNFSDESTGREEAILDNSGNFVLRTSNGVILWQSFDYPTDTLLPGLNFRLTHNSHALQRLISWKDPQDPSPGGFSYGADPKEFLQRFLWNGSTPYWRSIPCSNYLVVGPYMDLIKSTIFSNVRRIDDEIFVSFGVTDSSLTVKVKVDYSGKVKVLVWNSSNMLQWDILEAAPSPECGTYGFCGPFGYCDRTQPIPTCKCIDGFKPINNKERTDDRFSGGCKRKDALKCSHKNSFLTLTNIKIPDMFLYVKNTSFDECRTECIRNCSCTAYAYANMSTKAINGDDTRCLLWMGDLIDTEKFIGAGAENLYIRVNRLSGTFDFFPLSYVVFTSCLSRKDPIIYLPFSSYNTRA